MDSGNDGLNAGMSIEEKIRTVDGTYNVGWGDSHNETLFSQSLHHFTTSNDQEFQILKEYYTKELAMKAFQIFLLDYSMLPLEAPLWILDL